MDPLYTSELFIQQIFLDTCKIPESVLSNKERSVNKVKST